MRERDRRTYTLIWVLVTVVLTGILVVVGSPWFAVALVGVLLVGLVAFLRVTHPRGSGKPNINIFFDDLMDPEDLDEVVIEPTGPAAPVAARPAAAAPAATPTPITAPAPAAAAEADVIEMRRTTRPEASTPTLSDAVAASDEAAVSVTSGSAAPASSEVAEELSAHHVRLLRKVQTHLQDYE